MLSFGNFITLRCLVLISILIVGNRKYISAQTSENRLIVFVGEKISLKEVENPKTIDTIIHQGDTIFKISTPMDSNFVATYKVLQLIYGNYKSDTIEFVAYDHYGIPEFSKFPNVLLYIEKSKEAFYHVKYLFDAIYKTKNGHWAGGYNAYDYNQIEDEDVNIKPERLKFIMPAFVNLTDRREEDIKEWFFKPYYKIKGNKAEVVWGNYAEDLFKLKQYGRLNMYFDN